MKINTIIKYFFSYWLILPVVQFFGFILDSLFGLNEYGFNITIILLSNFLFVKYQLKTPLNNIYKLILSISSAFQFILISLIIDDFDFLLFLIISTPILNLISFFAFSYVKKKALYITISSLCLILFSGIYVSKPFSIYIQTKDDDVSFNKVPNIDLVKENGQNFVMKMDEIYVLNFWSLNCGICIQKMPSYSKLVDQYPNVNFSYVLYARNSESIKIANSYTMKYKFNKLRLKHYKQFEDSIKKPAFPYVMIIKNNQLLHSGLPLFESDFLNKSLNDLLYEYTSANN